MSSSFWPVSMGETGTASCLMRLDKYEQLRFDAWVLCHAQWQAEASNANTVFPWETSDNKESTVSALLLAL